MRETASLLEEAMAAHERGELEAAGALYEAILAREPKQVTSAILLGVLRSQRGDHGAAAEILTQALRLSPRSAQAHLNLGIALGQLGRLEEAISHYRFALLLKPEEADTLRHLASALQVLKQSEEALSYWERYLELHPDDAAAHLHCATVLQLAHREEEALRHLERALAISPALPEGRLHAGLLLLSLQRPAEALAHLDGLLDLDPSHGVALLYRSRALRELRRPMEALAGLDGLLALQPEHGEALLDRGNALVLLNRPEEAMATFDRLLKLQPNHVEALVSRGTTLHRLGQHLEAMGSYDAALSIKPDHALAHSNKIFVLDYVEKCGFEEHQAERRRFYEMQAKPLESQARIYINDRDPERPLVLGYVSADFRRHSAASCFGPVLRRHDHERFKVICYSGVLEEDDWTQGFQAVADEWRRTERMSDEALAEQIRADGVDVLIDLSGHSEGNRLLAFARKPAPLQVTAWGGGGGTGLPMIDYLFTDPVHIPEGARPLFAEKAYDLPCNITFEAAEDAPPVNDLPALRQGCLTFGCLNRSMKITPTALDLWAQILNEVPGAKLLLKDGLLDDPQAQARTRSSFADRGVDPARLILRGRTSHRDHLGAYGEVDIALDTFPQNGGITTWEALWMGVPVVTLSGNKPSSRISASILHALELDGWVAANEEDYGRLALRQAGDLDGLQRLRQGLRGRIEASTAGNAELYTRAVEGAYRRMWRAWLEHSVLGGRP